MTGRDPRLEAMEEVLESLTLTIRRLTAEMDGVLEWVRLCPQCGREIRRRDPMETVKCPCGWVWN
jgi:ribosomal protein L37AE/L43A